MAGKNDVALASECEYNENSLRQKLIAEIESLTEKQAEEVIRRLKCLSGEAN